MQPDLLCHHHPGREATSQCDRCGDYICEHCLWERDGKHVCQRCFDEMAVPARRWLSFYAWVAVLVLFPLAGFGVLFRHFEEPAARAIPIVACCLMSVLGIAVLVLDIRNRLREYIKLLWLVLGFLLGIALVFQVFLWGVVGPLRVWRLLVSLPGGLFFGVFLVARGFILAARRDRTTREGQRILMRGPVSPGSLRTRIEVRDIAPSWKALFHADVYIVDRHDEALYQCNSTMSTGRARRRRRNNWWTRCSGLMTTRCSLWTARREP